MIKKNWLKENLRISWLGGLPGSLNFRLRGGGGSGSPPFTYEERMRLYREEYSQETVRRAKRMGLNLIITDCFTGFGLKAEREHIENAIQFSKWCHQEGLAVGVYIQAGSLQYETLFNECPEAKDWIQVDNEGRNPTYGARQYYRRIPCPNQDGFVSYLKKAIKVAIKEIKAELLHFDNINSFNANTCYCPACRRKFLDFLKKKYRDPKKAKMRFGFSNFDNVVPPPTVQNHFSPIEGGDGTVTDPLFQEWLLFRCRSLENFYREINDYAHSLNKDIIVISNPALERGGNLALENGVDVSSYLKISEGAWAENQNYPGINEDGLLVTRAREFRMAKIYNKIILTYQHSKLYSRPRPSVEECTEEIELLLAEALSFGQPFVFYHPLWKGNPFLPQEIDKYINFQKKYGIPFLDTESIAEVAVLRSYPNLAYNWRGTYLALVLFEQTLIQSKIPFDIIFNEHLDNLSQYKILILANVESMSKEEIEKINSFVSNGGGLIVTGKTSLCNNLRRQRPKPGFSFLEKPLEKKITAKIKQGKGRIIYIPEIKEIISFKDSTSLTRSEIGSKYWRLPHNWKELVKAVEWTSKDNLSFKGEGPLNLGMEVNREKKSNRIFIHLINYDLRKKAKGIKIRIKHSLIPQIKKITLLSPEEKPQEGRFGKENKDILITVKEVKRYKMLVVE